VQEWILVGFSPAKPVEEFEVEVSSRFFWEFQVVCLASQLSCELGLRFLQVSLARPAVYVFPNCVDPARVA